MGIRLQIKGASFPNFISREMPSVEKSVGIWYFGGSDEDIVRNLSPNSDTNGTVFGSITHGVGHSVLTESAYMDTGVIIDTITSGYTMLSIASLGTVPDVMCGTWHSGVTDAMLYTAGDANTNRMALRGPGVAIGPLVVNASVPRFRAGVKSGSNTGKLYVHNGTSMQSISSSGASGTSTTTYRIGPNGGLGVTAASQTHFANVLFNSALSDAEIAELYEFFKYVGSKRGFII